MNRCLRKFSGIPKKFQKFRFFFTYKSPIAFICLDRFRRNLVWRFVYVPVCIPEIFVVLAQSIRLNLCLRKFVKFPKKVQKNGNPKGLLASLHGVFRGVYLFEMRTLCAPNISGQILQIPLLSPPGHLLCFPDTFVGFPALPCVFWFLCFFWWKNVLSINKDGRVALSHWEKIFKMKCKKLNHPLVPNPWPNYEFLPDFCL